MIMLLTGISDMVDETDPRGTWKLTERIKIHSVGSLSCFCNGFVFQFAGYQNFR